MVRTTMTTDGDLKVTLSLHSPLAAHRRSAGLERIERDARLKRFVLIGALASFLSFMGLTVWADNSHSSPAPANTNPTVIYYQDGNTARLNPPPVRTRSS